MSLYGDVVTIGGDVSSFTLACERALQTPREGAALAQIDTLLAQTSWDRTARAMHELLRVQRKPTRRRAPIEPSPQIPVPDESAVA